MSNQIIIQNLDTTSTTSSTPTATTPMMMMNTTPLTFPSNTKINQIVSMSPSSSQSNIITTTFSLSSPSSSSQCNTSAGSNIVSVSSPTTNGASGFANCSHCGSNGVKAAFYGKAKLYCSVACQTGKKNPHQQGVKRTLDALNYSTSPQTISLLNNSMTQTNSIQIANASNLNNTSQIPTLIPTSNFYTISTDSSNAIQSGNIFQTLTTTPQSASFNQIQTTQAPTTMNTIVYESNGKAILPQLSQQMSDNSFKMSDIEANKQTQNLTENIDNNSQDLPNGNAAKRARKSSSTSTGSTSKQSSVSNISSTIDEVLKKNLIETTNTKNNEPIKQTPNANKQIKNIQQNENENIPLTYPATANNFDWPSYLEENKSEAAPVFLFKHVPLCSFWRKICGIVVEVPNKNNKEDETYYWFAVIIKYSGYYVKLRYIGYEEDESEDDFWVHMCDSQIQHVGYARTVNLNIVPPEKISHRVEDWKAYLFDKLPRYVTIPKNYHSIIKEALKSRFERNMLLELVDKAELSKMRLAKIIENRGGRLRLKYENSNEFNDFWCHENSPLLHPIGWSVTVGHDMINVSEEYKRNSAVKYQTNKYEKNECSKNMFINPQNVELGRFKLKMKLEAIDPIAPSTIRPATVLKLLGDNYIIIKLDHMKDNLDRSLEFCYHRTSSSIFNPGFCRANALQLEKPFDYAKKFSWEKYLEETNSEFAPEDLFFKGAKGFMNPFKVGMKLESVDLVEPKLICPATVKAVAGRLIRINFDGWGVDFDQWIDCESSDIYPIGWCELVNYQLELPAGFITEPESNKKNMKKSTKKK